MRARRRDRERTHRGVVALALLVLVLPLLLGALALGTGGLAHEGLQAASTRDVSAAALNRIERYLQGDLHVGLAVPAGAVGAAPPPRLRAQAPEVLEAPAAVRLAPADAERRF